MHYPLCVAAIPCLPVEETYDKTYGASSLFCLTSELPDGERMPLPTLTHTHITDKRPKSQTPRERLPGSKVHSLAVGPRENYLTSLSLS